MGCRFRFFYSYKENKVFLAVKQTVSCGETKCFLRWNKRFLAVKQSVNDGEPAAFVWNCLLIQVWKRLIVWEKEVRMWDGCCEMALEIVRNLCVLENIWLRN